MMNTDLLEGESYTPINDNLKLIQKKNGLTFGTDALLLAAFMKRGKYSVAADFGSGTGVISLLCAARKKFKAIYAMEVQPEFVHVIERNIRLNGLEQVITPICRDIRESNFNETLDVVFTNPPYMASDSGKSNNHREKTIARHEIFGTIADFCTAAAKSLKYGGLFYAVYRPDRMIDLLCAMRNADLEPKRLITVHGDIQNPPSLILVEGKKGAAPSLIVPKPLFLRLNGVISDDMKYIYENGEFK